MDQIIKSIQDFKWSDLGDIDQGRKNLGPMTYVSVYRLMQYTLRKVLNQELDIEKTNQIFVQAGEMAGFEFAKSLTDLTLGFDEYVAELYNKLIEFKIGILRIEKADHEKSQYILTVGDDLDCSGLAFSDETVCEYDEGFLAGIFKAYTNKSFVVQEIDCWATGGRTCRFKVTPL